MKRWLYAIAASLALLGAGLVHGFWTDRWVTNAKLTDAAALLGDIPLQIGDWEGTDIEVNANQIGAGVTGCVQRSYTNRRLGVTVVLAIVNGRPGPIATHTPEACYGAAGYNVAQRQAVALDLSGERADFWTSVATRTRVTEETKVRLYWAWNGGEGWKASKDARQEFARYRYPLLHKLYVLRDLAGTVPASGSEASKNTPGDVECEAFIKELLPVLDRTLFAKDS
jgi:hypothetical protein